MIENDYRLIWRLLRRLGVPPHGVDDAVQQVFLIAAERLDDIRENSERAFAFGTALRVAQTLRRRSAREQMGAEADRNASPLPSPEELADQHLSVELSAPYGEEFVKYAVVHRDIIERFGRFPHRNRALGRETTPEEQAFLDGGGFAG